MEYRRNKTYLDSKIGYFNKDGGMATIYVGNLDFYKTEIEIKQLFEDFGHTTYVKVVKDEETKMSKGIAFVQMPNRKLARKAISYLNGHQLDGRTLKVSVAEENIESRKKKKRRKPYKPYVSKAERAKLAAEAQS